MRGPTVLSQYCMTISDNLLMVIFICSQSYYQRNPLERNPSKRYFDYIVEHVSDLGLESESYVFVSQHSFSMEVGSSKGLNDNIRSLIGNLNQKRFSYRKK